MNVDFKKMDWTLDVVFINRRKFVKIAENKDLDVYCYRREWKDTNRNPNHCFEVVRPVGKERQYPGSEDFGTYGLCLSKNDRNLQEKIDWYIKNGMGERFTSPSRK